MFSLFCIFFWLLWLILEEIYVMYFSCEFRHFFLTKSKSSLHSYDNQFGFCVNTSTVSLWLIKKDNFQLTDAFSWPITNMNCVVIRIKTVTESSQNTVRTTNRLKQLFCITYTTETGIITQTLIINKSRNSWRWFSICSMFRSD